MAVRRLGSGIVGWIRGAPRWADDPVQRQEGRLPRKGQEAESPSKGSLMAGGAGWGEKKLNT